MGAHPWRELRRLAHLRLHWRDDLPGSLRGATDGERVWIRSYLSQVERRCALAHELEHVRRGHRDHQPEPVEASVRHHAARYLLPDIHVVADAAVWAAGHPDEMAEVLWVTPDTLAARLDRRHLHPAEVAILRARWAAVEWGA